VVVASASEFLTSRGHRIEALTDYEIEDAFEAAWKNEQHDRVEFEYVIARYQVTREGQEELADWRRDAHAAIEGKLDPGARAATKMLGIFLSSGCPIVN
jgi:hypothetical protein